ncbi:MAG: response regulator transcription factor [Verrucomicrobiota bacterium]
MSTRVLLVDDQRIVRHGLRLIIEQHPGLRVVGEATDADAAIAAARESLPDLVFMDIHMPGQDGIEITRRLLAERPATRVLMLSGAAEIDLVQRALRAGACGYVLKDNAPEQLTAAIKAVLAGHCYLCPAITTLVLQDYGRLLAESPATQTHPARAFKSRPRSRDPLYL